MHFAMIVVLIVLYASDGPWLFNKAFYSILFLAKKYEDTKAMPKLRKTLTETSNVGHVRNKQWQHKPSISDYWRANTEELLPKTPWNGQ